jgi:Uma2 family endonuclease
MSSDIADQVKQLSRSEHPDLPSEDGILRRRLLQVLLAPPASEAITYEEFLDWADEDTLAEWVDGRIVMTSPASNEHQDISSFLSAVLRIFTELSSLGIVRAAPFQMKLEHGREPDLLFITNEHLARLKPTYLDGAADLVVEIISPESAGRDRGEKFMEYEAGGVVEYWLIDPQRRWAEFYQLRGGRYHLAYAGEEGDYHAHVLPGFWLRVEWLWQQPMPPVLDVLRALKVIE